MSSESNMGQSSQTNTSRCPRSPTGTCSSPYYSPTSPIYSPPPSPYRQESDSEVEFVIKRPLQLNTKKTLATYKVRELQGQLARKDDRIRDLEDDDRKLNIAMEEYRSKMIKAQCDLLDREQEMRQHRFNFESEINQMVDMNFKTICDLEEKRCNAEERADLLMIDNVKLRDTILELRRKQEEERGLYSQHILHRMGLNADDTKYMLSVLDIIINRANNCETCRATAVGATFQPPPPPTAR